MSRLVIAGGSGFLGSGLIAHLGNRFDEIIVLTRGRSAKEGKIHRVQWDARTSGDWSCCLDGATALVNLVGRSVDCRKTPKNKALILQARVNSVMALAAACKAVANPPAVWVQAATAHIFGDTADQILDDSSPLGVGFAPDVGRAWEQAVQDHVPISIRTAILRISFVLGRHGGPFAILARLARCGLGGAAGSGQQYISWIHQLDFNRIVEQAIFDATMRGKYVATAPGPVRNEEFMRLLRQAVHRPWSPPVPTAIVQLGSWMLRTDPELVLLGRRCVPTRLQNEGFVFDHPQLPAALADLVNG